MADSNQATQTTQTSNTQNTQTSQKTTTSGGSFTPFEDRGPKLFKLRASNGVNFETTILPDGFSFTKSASWEQTQPANRSAPIVNYSSSEAITFSVSCKLFKFRSSDDILKQARDLQSLAYPTETGTLPPPMCWVTLAGYLKDFQCVCNSATIAAVSEAGWTREGEPMAMTVELNFLEIDLYNKTDKDIRSNRGGSSGGFSSLGGIKTPSLK